MWIGYLTIIVLALTNLVCNVYRNKISDHISRFMSQEAQPLMLELPQYTERHIPVREYGKSFIRTLSHSALSSQTLQSRVTLPRTMQSRVTLPRTMQSRVTLPRTTMKQHINDTSDVSYEENFYDALYSKYMKLVSRQRRSIPKFNICHQSINRTDSFMLSMTERRGERSCISNYYWDYRRGNSIWVNNKARIRWEHHVYLNNSSTVLDIGGNTGFDATNIVARFHPKLYVILEPVKLYYDHLVKLFSYKPSVIVFPFGAGSTNIQLNVSISGKNGDATSVFTMLKTNQTATIQLFNITEIFLGLGLSCLKELDLLTINCEGCEFEVLEELLKTNIILFIKNIQFASHTNLPRLKNSTERYCRIQMLLSRTHVISYQYKFIWESWRRK